MKTVTSYTALRSIFAILVCLSLYVPTSAAAGYDYTPAIIQLNRNQQNDTVGFNLVKDLYKVFYKNIINQTVTLWDSPAKKTKIKPNALQLIESQNDLKFRECADLFIYEYWKLYKKDFEFQVLGFSFYSRSEDNKKVNFGYVDASDVQSLLSSMVIPTNINGSTNLSYWHAIMSKTYNFNLVKFGNVDLVKNPSVAFDLKDQVFGAKKIRTNQYVITPSKEIEYFVIPGRDTTTSAHWLCKSVELYFQQNRNEYFNRTKAPSISYLDIHAPLKVTRVEVSEIWQKNSKTEIAYTPHSVRIFVNDKPMPEMSIQEINQMQLLVQFRPFTEYLKEKEFKFNIKRVNYEPIYGYQADEIKTALYSKDWNKIQYVAPNLLKDRNKL
ncbi:MAG: hypothetical protein JJ975_04800 [Bacteroidia bacterium]|nr:hypothetical protein [Bacteroidia bacterium]